MRHWNRALTTLAAVIGAGFLLWFAPHFHRFSAGGYWGVIAVMALAGLLVGIAQLPARHAGNPPASFLLVFLPVLAAAGWVIVAAEPRSSWLRNHVLSWSGDMGIAHAVHNLGEHVSVLAFALGVVFGLTFEPAMLRRRVTAGLPGPIVATGPIVSAAAPPAATIVAEAPAEAAPPSPPEAADPALAETSTAPATDLVADAPTVVHREELEEPAADDSPATDLVAEAPTVVHREELGEPAADGSPATEPSATDAPTVVAREESLPGPGAEPAP